MKKNIKSLSIIFLGVLLILISWIFYDIRQNDKIVKTKAKDDFARSLILKENDIYHQLETGMDVDFTELRDTLAYLDRRYDTSDFRFPSLIRILYEHDDKIPAIMADEIKDTITGLKFWMNEPGDDSICYWSENHQILLATGEYLFGHYYKDEIFENNGMTGQQHSDYGKERLLTWLEQRFLYGFTEWYSSTYYVEDLAPLAVLIDLAPDEEVREKAKIVLDLLIYDLATQNYKGTFTTTSGRMYESAKMSGRRGSMKSPISLIWEDYNKYLEVENVTGMNVNFLHVKNYEVPEVLVNIGYDQEVTNIYKASNGLNLSEFEDEGLIGLEDHQIMMQWASEAFSNPEIINNTMKYIDKHDMFSNEFLADLKMINLGIIKTFNLADNISNLLEPVYNGTAIQRGNTYTYRTPNYSMATTQAYHPGTYGDQHSLFALTINNDFNIFNQHPAAALKEGGALGSSPNYWVGNGYNPHTIQFENTNISIYLLPEKENKLGKLVGLSREITPYTHSFFPKQYMDEVIIDDNIAFGKINDVYVALIGKNNLVYKPIEHTDYDVNKELTADYDLIQEGLETYWITEVGTKDDYGTFQAFIDDINSRDVSFENNTLRYNNMELKYNEKLIVNGQVQEHDYKRFDSKYSQTDRKADEILIEFNNQSLRLNFKNVKREVIN